MVNWPISSLRPTAFGAIASLIFLLLYFIEIANAVRLDSNEPQLVIVFFGFPMSWLFISIFHPVLEWMGPYGATSRIIADWLLLGFAGVLQYWLIGTLAAYLIVGGRRDENDSGRK